MTLTQEEFCNREAHYLNSARCQCLEDPLWCPMNLFLQYMVVRLKYNVFILKPKNYLLLTVP